MKRPACIAAMGKKYGGAIAKIERKYGIDSRKNQSYATLTRLFATITPADRARKDKLFKAWGDAMSKCLKRTAQEERKRGKR